MICILITGLDGSGKSTLLANLEAAGGSSTGVLRVPEIDSGKLSGNAELHKAAILINKLNKQADEQNLPQLKLLAMFFSMLVFKDILEELKKSNLSVILCERHPLIDTGVYGYFYVQKLNPATFPVKFAAQIEMEYPKELDFLLSKIEFNTAKKNNGKIIPFISFLYQYFVTEKKFAFEDLKKLFQVEMPDKIVYLKADADILMARLKDRKRREAHESKEVFEKLLPLYDRVLKESGVETKMVNANDFDNLNEVFEELKTLIF